VVIAKMGMKLLNFLKMRVEKEKRKLKIKTRPNLSRNENTQQKTQWISTNVLRIISNQRQESRHKMLMKSSFKLVARHGRYEFMTKKIKKRVPSSVNVLITYVCNNISSPSWVFFTFMFKTVSGILSSVCMLVNY
jgi:hypothetical protein